MPAASLDRHLSGSDGGRDSNSDDSKGISGAGKGTGASNVVQGKPASGTPLRARHLTHTDGADHRALDPGYEAGKDSNSDGVKVSGSKDGGLDSIGQKTASGSDDGQEAPCGDECGYGGDTARGALPPPTAKVTPLSSAAAALLRSRPPSCMPPASLDRHCRGAGDLGVTPAATPGWKRSRADAGFRGRGTAGADGGTAVSDERLLGVVEHLVCQVHKQKRRIQEIIAGINDRKQRCASPLNQRHPTRATAARVAPVRVPCLPAADGQIRHRARLPPSRIAPADSIAVASPLHPRIRQARQNHKKELQVRKFLQMAEAGETIYPCR